MDIRGQSGTCVRGVPFGGGFAFVLLGVFDDEIRSPAELLDCLMKTRRIAVGHDEFADNSLAGLHGSRRFTGILVLVTGSSRGLNWGETFAAHRHIDRVVYVHRGGCEWYRENRGLLSGGMIVHMDEGG